MKNRLSILFLMLCGLSAPAQATCYQLIKGESIIYQDERPPFDVSLSPQRSADMEASSARGEVLVFFEPSCRPTEYELGKFSDSAGRANLAQGGSPSGSSAAAGRRGGDVQVRGHTRRDGTYVRPHTRARAD